MSTPQSFSVSARRPPYPSMLSRLSFACPACALCVLFTMLYTPRKYTHSSTHAMNVPPSYFRRRSQVSQVSHPPSLTSDTNVRCPHFLNCVGERLCLFTVSGPGPNVPPAVDNFKYRRHQVHFIQCSSRKLELLAIISQIPLRFRFP